tara:strand:+ start:414 stop:968 length:555 start_codon:yes stop_codon:yes gene_type:complete
MKFEETFLKGVYVITPKIIGDERGWFMRTYCENLFSKNIPNFNSKWRQMNHSFSEEKFTWRGFHFQESPYKETKLIRCISGKVLDYILDIRIGSETFLKCFSTELSSKNKKMIYVPKGFAHGFLTLESNSELVYIHDEYYNPEFERGINYLDPKLKIILPEKPKEISQRDKSHKLLNNNFKGIK